jgi:polyhydroxyalkanoate synthase subunit PhaC
MNPLSPEQVAAAAANVFDALFRGGLADLRRTPASIIEQAPQRTVYRYLRSDESVPRALPVLLVPPLAAPTICFDLRRGCSLAEHLIALGHETYLVDYGEIGFSDRELGLEHWIQDVIPGAVRRVAKDTGRPVQVVGWCLGGIMSLLAAADDPGLPINSVAMVASPFDFAQIGLMAPLRPIANINNGMLGTTLYRLMGGAPAPLVKRGYQLAALDKYLTKPLTMLTHLEDRDFLAQVQAVDNFTNNMLAYPGRTFGQLYHRFFRVNELARGRLKLPHGVVDLGAVGVPVLSVAGNRDYLAPRPAVHHVAELLPNAPQVRLETAPGGHLGVLTGRSAAATTWSYLDEFLSEHGPAGSTAPPLSVPA